MLTDRNLLENARNLRRGMTKEERKLWYAFLRKHQQPFRRQFIIENYILDFYCPSAKLAIEIDGAQHYSDEALVYDQNRTDRLNQLGIMVLRFTNVDIQRRFQAVCELIDFEVKGRM